MKKLLLGVLIGAASVAMYRNYVNYRIFADKEACIAQYQQTKDTAKIIPCLGAALKFKTHEKFLGIIIDFTGEGR